MPNPSSILNVDHDRARREANSRLLSSAGIVVHEASSGREALQSIPGMNPDVVLLAGKLPDIPAVDVCRQLRTHPGFSSVILLQDGKGASSNGGGIPDSGPDAWLPERCAAQPFLATIQALLDLRKTRMELATAAQSSQAAAQTLQRSLAEAEGFAFQACHDLEEPVRALSALAHMIDQAPGRLTPEEMLFLGQSVAGIERVRRLFGNLLSYYQIAGDQKSSTRPVDLNLAVRAAIYGLGKSVRETGTEIHADEQLPMVLGNLPRLQQVFQCLLMNAIQYRQQQLPAVIRIGVQEAGEGPDQAVICVADNGVGIAKQYHKVVFDPFKRLHGREIPGSGMGLAIAKRIVEAHHGRIWVESEPGHGATFFFTLTLAGA